MADGHYCIRIYVMCAGFSFSPEPLLILLESIKCIFIFKQKKVKSLPNEIIEANNGHSRHALIVAVVHFFFFFFLAGRTFLAVSANSNYVTKHLWRNNNNNNNDNNDGNVKFK